MLPPHPLGMHTITPSIPIPQSGLYIMTASQETSGFQQIGESFQIYL